MAIFLAIAAAAQLAAPQQLGDLVNAYPAAAVERGQQGSVAYSVLLDTKGKPLLCSLERVEGANFGPMICQAALKARYRPARDSDGKPAHGLIRSTIRFRLPDAPAMPPFGREADLSLNVQPRPGFLEKPTEIAVTAAIDVDGKIADCAFEGNKKEAQLASVACAQLKAQWSGAPVSDGQGNKWRHVRKLNVAFVPDK